MYTVQIKTYIKDIQKITCYFIFPSKNTHKRLLFFVGTGYCIYTEIVIKIYFLKVLYNIQCCVLLVFM